MINKKVARRYTLALYQIAEENKAIDKLKEDFILIKKSIESSRELKIFLSTPIINQIKKAVTIKALFEKNTDKITIGFLRLICLKNRSNFLNDICIDFLNLINEKLGIVKANIKTAIDISAKEKKSLTNKLENYTGKKIEAYFSVDPDIMGGFTAKVDDTVIDASIQKQLQMLYDHFRKGSFKFN